MTHSATEPPGLVLPLTTMTQNDVGDEPGSVKSQMQTCEQQLSRKRKHPELAVNHTDVQELTVKSSLTPSGKAAQLIQAISQPVEQKYYCTVCKEILPISAFYPSYMQRHLSWCKSCTRIKQVERKKKQVNDALTHPASSRPDHTRSMLERLRRRCSQTCHLEGLSKHHTVGFDAKVARPLLAFWKWQTALQPLTESSDKVRHVISGDSLRLGVKWSFSVPGYQPLRWIVWAKSDLTPIMPWEVIPVTHHEALLFRNVPIPLRSQLVSDTNVVQQIECRLQRLHEICLSEPGLAIASLLERYNQFTLAADESSIKLIEETDFR